MATSTDTAPAVHKKYLHAVRRLARLSAHNFIPICPYCGERSVILVAFEASCEVQVHEDGWSFEEAKFLNSDKERFRCSSCTKDIAVELVFSDPASLNVETKGGKNHA